MKTTCFLVPALAALASTAVAGDNNATIAHSDAHEKFVCQPKWQAPGPLGLRRWFYNSFSDGPHNCKYEGGAILNGWSMLNSYRAGGTEGVHWKYTDTNGEGDCITNWYYHSSDGQTQLTYVRGTSTTYGGSRPWCLLPVYRSGGVEGKQWANCVCDGR